MIQLEYDPDEYWEARGGGSYRDYTASPGYRQYQQAQSAFFRKLIADLTPQRLLDFGCGSGKLFPLWVDVPEVHAYDRARSQITVAREEAGRLRPDVPFRVMHCLLETRTEIPYDDDYFDLVVAAEVLLHIVPDDVDALVRELHRVCRGHLAVVTAAPFDNPAPHCFNHDYNALLDNRFDIVDDHSLYRQRYLVARKRGAPHDVTVGSAKGAANEAPPKKGVHHAVVTS